MSHDSCDMSHVRWLVWVGAGSARVWSGGCGWKGSSEQDCCYKMECKGPIEVDEVGSRWVLGVDACGRDVCEGV
jgi:hypothetical protein